ELSGQKNSEPILDFLHDPKHEARAVQTLDNAKKQLANPEEKSAKGVIGLDSVTVLPPIARPTKIICLGGNFSDHLQEGSASLPPFPVTFLKSPTSLVGHKAPVFYPPKVKLLDYEVELAAVIVEKCKDVSKKNSLDYVAGFSVFNDISTPGTPSGVAIYRKPDKTPYLLKPGDLVESKIESLGKLQNTIVRETKPTRLPSRHLVLA